MDFIEIELKKFDSLVKRKDIKNPQWFAMPNDILEHPDFFDVTGDEFKVFTWICGVATKLNTSRIKVFVELCARRLNLPTETVKLTINKLSGKRWDVTDTYVIRTESVHTRTATEQNRTEQNKEEESDKAQILGNKYFKRISPETKELLFKTYPIDFIKRELITGITYLERNIQRYMGSEADYLVSHFSRQFTYLSKVGEDKSDKQDRASRVRSQRAVMETQKLVSEVTRGVPLPDNLKETVAKLTMR